jgi:hypothetical protein
MNREVHVRFCERLGVQFPGPTLLIAFNERHLKRLLSDYVRYYHEDRTHLGLRKETPAGRVRSTDRGTVVSQARLGGLHHRYDRAA